MQKSTQVFHPLFIHMHLWLKHFQINYADFTEKKNQWFHHLIDGFFPIFGDVKMLFHTVDYDAGQNWNQTRN